MEDDLRERLKQLSVFLAIVGASALCLVMLPLMVMPNLAGSDTSLWYLLFAVGMGTAVAGGVFLVVSSAFPRSAVRAQDEKPKAAKARKSLGILQATLVIATAAVGLVWLLMDTLLAGEEKIMNLPAVFRGLLFEFSKYSIPLLFLLLLALIIAWLNYIAARRRMRKE
jgi:hypothetical protein